MKRVWAGGSIAAATVAALAWAATALGQPPAAAPPPTLVEVRPIVREEVAETRTFVGTTVPNKKATVGSAVAGRVSEVFVEIGDRVAAKDPLAQLLTETIRAEVDGAEADLRLRQQQLAELENGALPQEIEQAQAAMEAAKARADYLVARQERFDQLEGTRTVTAEELGEVLATTQEASAAYREAKAAYDLVKQGPRLERIAQAESSVAVQQALVDKLRDQLTKHTMISRFDGYVVAKHTEIGAWVNQGDPVAEVVALDVVDVQVHVLENYVAYVKPGHVTRVEIPALPGEVFAGEVVAVDPEADLRSRTFEVKVRVTNQIENGVPRIKSGMVARVVLPTGPSVDALMIPKDAVTLGGDQKRIWTVDPASIESYEVNGQPYRKGTATPRSIQLGTEEGDRIQAIGSLRIGEFVVTKGNERIVAPPGKPAIVTWSAASESGSAEAESAAQAETPPRGASS